MKYIAYLMKRLGFTSETGSDEHDLKEISRWEIEDMLGSAYAQGIQDALEGRFVPVEQQGTELPFTIESRDFIRDLPYAAEFKCDSQETFKRLMRSYDIGGIDGVRYRLIDDTGQVIDSWSKS